MLDLAEATKQVSTPFCPIRSSESCPEIAKQLSVAEVESVLVEGRSLKVLFMKIGENKISVFMEKDASQFGIIKRILT